MKKYFKKISALLMAAIMVLSMCTAVFAVGETTAVPKNGDAAQVTINGLEPGVTIKAYQIVDGVYKNDSEGFTGFTWTELSGKSGNVFTTDGEGNQILDLSQADLNNIVKTINDNGTTPKTITLGANNLSNETLEVGTWLLVVSGGKKVYNPMVVSVYYSDENGNPVGGTLNADKAWNLVVVGGVTYAKESDITIEKVANKGTAETDGKTTTTEESKEADVVTYTITGVIPAYKAEYKEITYEITDTLTNLKLVDDSFVVTVGGKTADSTKYTLIPEKGIKFKLTFTDATYLKSLADKDDAGRTVTVTYKATLTESATTWKAGSNKAEVKYTNSPDGTTSTKEDNTNTYTFDINGQIKKVEKVKNEEVALDGAEFTLYRKYVDKELSDPVGTYETTDNGLVVFKGLAAGTYYLTETKAPNTYTLNTNIYEITITPKYKDGTSVNESGKKELKSYTITVKEMKADGTAVGDPKTSPDYEKGTDIGVLVNILNTKVGQLPSTGGMGTYIFTIAGVVLMACAAGAFIISRKKSSEE